MLLVKTQWKKRSVSKQVWPQYNPQNYPPSCPEVVCTQTEHLDWSWFKVLATLHSSLKSSSRRALKEKYAASSCLANQHFLISQSQQLPSRYSSCVSSVCWRKTRILVVQRPLLQPPGFGPLCLISIPYQKCTGTDLLACEPDVLSSSAHPPQRSISGSFPLSGTPGKLIIFSLYFSWGAILMVILIVKVELVKENTFFFLWS